VIGQVQERGVRGRRVILRLRGLDGMGGWAWVVVPTVFVEPWRPFSSIVCAVWLRLWASMPIMELCPLHRWVARTGRSAYPNRGRCHAPLKPDRPVLLGVGWPQNKLKPRRRKSRQSEPADSYTLTLGCRLHG
jgi:hypothetical protein